MVDRAEDRALLAAAVRLKELDRSGWIRAGIPRPESVAAHSFGVAFAALVLCPPHLDRGKLLAMAVLHDLAEVRVGDITPHDGIPKAEKARRELEAMRELVGHRPELLALFEEIEQGASPESRFLHGLDKLDMSLTADLYAERGHDTAEFHRSAAPMMDELLDALHVAGWGRGSQSRDP